MSYWKLQLKQHEANNTPTLFHVSYTWEPDHSYPLKKRRVFLPSSLWEYLTLQLQRLRDDLELGSSLSRLRELHPVPNGTPPVSVRSKPWDIPTKANLGWSGLRMLWLRTTQGFFYGFVQTHHPWRSNVILLLIICMKSLAPAMILPISYLEHVHPCNKKLLLPWKLPGEPENHPLCQTRIFYVTWSVHICTLLNRSTESARPNCFDSILASLSCAECVHLGTVKSSEWRIFLSFVFWSFTTLEGSLEASLIDQHETYSIFVRWADKKIPSRETTFSEVHHGAVMIRQNWSKQDNIHLPSQGTCWSRQRFVCPKCQKRLWQSRDTCSVAHKMTCAVKQHSVASGKSTHSKWVFIGLQRQMTRGDIQQNILGHVN